MSRHQGEMRAASRDVVRVHGDVHEVDPFDLPEWLGTAPVTWAATSGLRAGPHVTGLLTGEGHDDQVCDLLAVDEAYPVVVADARVRHDAHQAWRHGQILTLGLGAEHRLTLAVPGTRFDADTAIDAISRLARAVGGSPDSYAVHLRIGQDGPGRR